MGGVLLLRLVDLVPVAVLLAAAVEAVLHVDRGVPDQGLIPSPEQAGLAVEHVQVQGGGPGDLHPDVRERVPPHGREGIRDDRVRLDALGGVVLSLVHRVLVLPQLQDRVGGGGPRGDQVVAPASGGGTWGVPSTQGREERMASMGEYLRRALLLRRVHPYRPDS